MRGLLIEILQLLNTSGALQPRDLFQRSEQAADAKQVANALQRLKSAGLVECANNQCWRVTDAGRTEARLEAKHGEAEPAPVPAAPVGNASSIADVAPRLQDDIEPTVHPPLAQRIERAANKQSAAITALQRAAQQAQDALDAYVWEVGDAAVLQPLMTARDAASQALAAYEAQA